MGSRSPEAVPGRQPWLALCRLVVENFVSFALPQTAELIHSVSPPLPTKSATLRGSQRALAPFGEVMAVSLFGGHSVVMFATFLFLIFWLCMRKGNRKADTKNRPRSYYPQSVMYLPVKNIYIIN